MIPESKIAAVRAATDIRAVVGEKVDLQRNHRSWRGLCPFHREKTPSFRVMPERHFFYCHGCHESGDAFDFLQKTEGLSFREAVLRLAERAGIVVEELSPEERQQQDAARQEKQDMIAANLNAAYFFERMLSEHPEAHVAREELQRRELQDESTLQAFRIGYAPSGVTSLGAYLRQQGISISLAERAGLVLRKGTNDSTDRFRNRLMFAVLDAQGQIVAFSGRILPDPKTGLIDRETGKYINSPESALYKKGETVFGLYQAKSAIRAAGQAVMVEGNFDVVSLHARGIQNVVAPLGTAFTIAQARLLRQSTSSLVLLFDGDSAGRKATGAARATCAAAGLSVRAGRLPEGIDPDALVREQGKDAVLDRVQAADGILEFLLMSCLDQASASTSLETQRRLLDEIARIIEAEDDPAMQALAYQYIERAAGKFIERDPRSGNIDEGLFKLVCAGLRRRIVRGVERVSAAPATRDLVVEKALGALIDFPDLLGEPQVASLLSVIEGDSVFVVSSLVRYTAGERDAMTRLPESVKSWALGRLADPVLEDKFSARKEALDNLYKLRRRVFQKEREALMQSLTGTDEEAKLLQSINDYARRGRAKPS